MDIKKIACIGAGIIGHSWATLFSSKGLEVQLQDLSLDILINAIKRVEANLIFLEQKKLLENGDVKAALKRIKITTSLAEAVNKADYVQESIPDNYKDKKRIFREIDTVAPGHAILASSSSGLRMTEIQKETNYPDRCILVHPILPPHLIPLVEICGGINTSEETVEATRDFMLFLGKMPVVLNKEVPGYIVNRLTAALWREAISLITNGVASAEDVDKAFCMGIGLRDPIFGPFLRAHVAGGGIQRFLENYDQSYTNRWKTMECWTSLPISAAEKVIESVKEMELLHTKTLEEIERERDEKLVKIINLMLPKHPFY